MSAQAFVEAHQEDLRAASRLRGALHVNPEAMMAAAAHVQRVYGYSGYVLGTVQHNFVGDGLFEVRHSDGSSFLLYADRYGNVARVPDAPDAAAA